MAEARVTLILGEDLVEASRDDLTSKSEYFASLFSGNFRDSLSNEYRINYDIDGKTLRTFVSWASESATSAENVGRFVKSSLCKYLGNSSDFDDLLQLLQLSVLFAAETLVHDLTDLIACHWLIPEKSIQLWLLAKELNLSTLRNLALATCVERLGEVPEFMIIDLPAEELIELLGNVRAQGDPALILQLVERWKSLNIPYGKDNAFGSRYPFTLDKHMNQPMYREIVEEQRLKNNVQCVVGQKLVDDNVEKACIYCWNGTSFFELVEIRNLRTISTKNIVGRQVVGRGSDIYLVGGEYGLGTGRFETEIWRYSTISKTWYYVTSLPEPRRHMAVVFSKEKLFVIGGVGRHRLKLSTIDVYNIYTGKWSKAADIVEEFTSVPPTCVVGDNLVLYKSALYHYNSQRDSWFEEIPHFEMIPVQFLTAYDGSIYIVDSGNGSRSRIWLCELNSNQRAVLLGDCVTPFNNQVANGPYLIGFSHKEETIFVEVMKVSGMKLETLLVYSEKKCDVGHLSFDARIGCFNIFNPNSLDETLNVLDL